MSSTLFLLRKPARTGGIAAVLATLFGATASAVPTAPPAMSASALPPGHPPIGGGPGARPADGTDDPSLPPGTVMVRVRKPSAPPGVEHHVRIVTWDSDRGTETRIVAGEATTRGNEDVRLDHIKTGPPWLHQAVVEHEGVPYVSPPFVLGSRCGKQVQVKVVGVTDDPDLALIGVQAFVLVDPKQRHLQVEQLFRFANLGELTWNAHAIRVALPSDATAVQVAPGTGPMYARAVPGRGLLLTGVVPPGSAEVAFSYQLPYTGQTSELFTLTFPPRVGLLRVMSPVSSKITFEVQGLSPPTRMQDPDARNLMLVEHAVAPFGDQIETINVRVKGVPVHGYARWIALALSALAMIGGLALAIRWQRSPATDVGRTPQPSSDDLLDRIRAMDRARAAGELDALSYEVERASLINRLARLLMDLDRAQQRSASPSKPG